MFVSLESALLALFCLYYSSKHSKHCVSVCDCHQMPSKKKKYNSRFPPARIKKIMQSDEDVGKVAQVVPIIISKALEIFVASLLRSSSDVTRTRNARTLTPSHIKASILSDNQFHFLRDLAQSIPDVNTSCDDEEDANNTGNTTPNALTVTAPRLQRKSSQSKTSSTTTTTTRSSSTTTGRTRGRPRKRPIESQQTSISPLQHIEEHEQHEEDEEEEEEDEDEDDEEDEEEEEEDEEQSKQ